MNSEYTCMPHLVTILTSAKRIASEIYHGTTCVVHCSDGWDRTSQLTSLPMLFLDPYYRTITGFQVLLEKEWLSFGHKFAVRSGGDMSSAKAREDYLDKQRSPIFVQFLDCVWQIKKQFSTLFEFNDNFLIACLRHVYSGRYGTFLFDSERERAIHQCRTKTVSLWTEMNVHRAPFINDEYDHLNSEKRETTVKMYSGMQVEIPLLSLWPAYEELWRQGVVGETTSNLNGKKSSKAESRSGSGSGSGSGSCSGGGGGGGSSSAADLAKPLKSVSSSSSFFAPDLPPRSTKKRLSVPPPTPPPRPTTKAPHSSMTRQFSMDGFLERVEDVTNGEGVKNNNKKEAASADISTPPPRPKSRAPDAAHGEEEKTTLSPSRSTYRKSAMQRRNTADDDVFDFA